MGLRYDEAPATFFYPVLSPCLPNDATSGPSIIMKGSYGERTTMRLCPPV